MQLVTVKLKSMHLYSHAKRGERKKVYASHCLQTEGLSADLREAAGLVFLVPAYHHLFPARHPRLTYACGVAFSYWDPLLLLPT